MLTRLRTLLLVGVVIAVLMAIWLVLAQNCPSAEIALTTRARTLHILKNRTAFPQESDFDSRITLDALLQPGDDCNRWSTDRAARLQGEVIDIAYAGTEATNCYNPLIDRLDLHEEAILKLFEQIKDLLNPPPPQPRKHRIGF